MPVRASSHREFFSSGLLMPDNATTLAAWDVVLPEHRPMVGDSTHPSVRYSACVVWHEGRIVVTHGYFYNHDIRQPAWLSDAWVFEVSRGAWRQVHRGERHGAPSARYSASAVVFDGGLYMYGGDDGGHKHSLHNYVFKAWNSELWRLDLSSFTWSSVTPAGRAPPKRALHVAALVGATPPLSLSVSLSLSLSLSPSLPPSLPPSEPAACRRRRDVRLRRARTRRHVALLLRRPCVDKGAAWSSQGLVGHLIRSSFN